MAKGASPPDFLLGNRPDSCGVYIEALQRSPIELDRQQLEKLMQLINAIATMVPQLTATVAPRGDMRSHAEKAQEVAAELMPPSRRAVGTSGPAANVVMVGSACASASAQSVACGCHVIEEHLDEADVSSERCSTGGGR